MPGSDLMERAGSGLAEVCARTTSGPIVVVCGGGNNGGDGLVAARLFAEQGRETQRAAARRTRPAPRRRQNEPGAAGGGAARTVCAARGLEGAACIVDAILGTGFVGVPREPAAGAITAINAARAAGARSWSPATYRAASTHSTGEVSGPRSPQPTVTFHAAKPGLWIAPGKAPRGRWSRSSISGIPRGADRSSR